MAQLMIDTDIESVAGLMLLSRLLTDYANMRAVQDKATQASYPIVDIKNSPGDTNHQAELYAAALHGAGAFGTPDTVVEPDPTKLFGKFPVPTGTNVVPLFPQGGVLGVTPGAPTMAPSVPLEPTIAPTNVLPVTTIVAGGATLPSATTATVTTVQTNAPSAPVNGVTVLNADVDSAGLSWDERIHSSSKAKKGDGTWKIKRGLEAGVAQMVTAELMAKKLAHTATAPLAGTLQTGVALVAANPLVPLPPTVPVPPGATGMPVAPVPGQPANVPANIPTPPQAPGAVPVAPVSPVARFREMMSKISAGLGSKAITQENVKAAHEGVGLQQLQQAVLHPEKIPDIERALGLS